MRLKNLAVALVICVVFFFIAHTFRYQTINSDNIRYQIVFDRWKQRTCYSVAGGDIVCSLPELSAALRHQNSYRTTAPYPVMSDDDVGLGANKPGEISYEQAFPKENSSDVGDNNSWKNFTKIICILVSIVFIAVKRKKLARAIKYMANSIAAKFYQLDSANMIVNCLTSGIPGLFQALYIYWVFSFIGKLFGIRSGSKRP